MTVAEHDYVVEVPDGVQIEDVTDFVRGWFKAEVQILVCKDCHEYSVGWRRVSGPANTPNTQAGNRA